MKIESQQDLFPQSVSKSTWPTREEALHKFQNFNPSRYAKTRNFLNGHISHDILSEGILPGCIQVPSNGQPIVLMRDIPCTGGYPKIAILASEDISKIAQLPPGTKITFDL